MTTDTTTTNPDPNKTSEGGGSTAAFYEAFTDDGLKTSAAGWGYKSTEDLAKGYVNLEKRLGAPLDRHMVLPADPNDADGMRAIWTKLGLPEKADGYGVTLPENATAEDKAMLGKFTDAMHKAGAPAPFVKASLEFMQAQQAEQAKTLEAAQTQQKTEGEAALKKEFGAAYDSRLGEINRLVEKHGSPELAKAIKDNAALNPNLVSMLGKIVDAIAEPGHGEARSGDAANGDRDLTPAAANAARLALEGDPVKGKALLDKTHPQHAAVTKEWSRLIRLANPQPQDA